MDFSLFALAVLFVATLIVGPVAWFSWDAGYACAQKTYEPSRDEARAERDALRDKLAGACLDAEAARAEATAARRLLATADDELRRITALACQIVDPPDPGDTETE